MKGVVIALYDIPNGEVWILEEIIDLKKYIESYALRWSVVENLPVKEVIKYDCENADELITNYIFSLANLGEVGISTVCYILCQLLIPFIKAYVAVIDIS